MSETKTYSVRMPFTGYVDLLVEADSEEGAVEQFYEKVEKYRGLDDAILSNEGAWEFAEEVFGGNVFYGLLRKLEVEAQ